MGRRLVVAQVGEILERVRFPSSTPIFISPRDGIGRRTALRTRSPKGRGSSTLPEGTIAPVTELADVSHSECEARKGVRVQIYPGAPF